MQVRKERRVTERKPEDNEPLEAKRSQDTTSTDELLEEVDKALEGIDELLATTYRQAGGE